MSNTAIVQKYLQDKGLNNKAVAGVMGNIQQESSFDTHATNSNSGAFGLFQWLGSRKTNLENYAKNSGTSVTDINTQLDFFWHELNTSEKKSKNMLLNSSYDTASDYAVAFEKSFERSGGSALENRKKYAENYYSVISGESESSVTNSSILTSSSSGKSSNEYGLKWWGDIVKVVLVLLLIVLGVLMGVLSFNSTAKE